jgi:hypothetical protein
LVSLPKKWSHADTAIACTPLPNLGHSVAVIAPLLPKRQLSGINISRQSDIVQAFLLPKADGDHIFPQPRDCGDHKFPQRQKVTFEVAKPFMEAIVFKLTPCPIISDEKYSMVDEEWKPAIEAQDSQRVLAGAAGGRSSVCQLPGGLSLKIAPQSREAVIVYSVFSCLIGLMMILNP